MGRFDNLRALFAAAALGMLAGNSEADIFTWKDHSGNTRTIEGEVEKEYKHCYVVRYKKGGEWQREYILKEQLISRVEKPYTPDEQPVAQNQTLRLDDVLDKKGDIQFDKAAQLTLDDLRRISGLPELNIVNHPRYRFLLDHGNRGAENANVRTKMRWSDFPHSQKTVSAPDYKFETGPGIVQKGGLPYLKYPSREKIAGITLPRDLVLIESTYGIGAANERRPRIYSNLPCIEERVLGSFVHNQKKYLVVDTCLMFSGLKNMSEKVRDYYPLRGKDSRTDFDSKAVSQKQAVTVSGRNFTLLYSNPEELAELTKKLPLLEASTAEQVDKALYADMVATNVKSATLEKMLANKTTFGEVVGVLDSYFRQRVALARGDSVKGFKLPVESLLMFPRHDCDTGSKIVANAFRKIGFPTSLVRAEKGEYTILRGSEGGVAKKGDVEGHVWTEIYVPQLDLVVVFDVNNPNRNCIFRPTRDRMDYSFDEWGQQGVWHINSDNAYEFSR
jgi:hypothetical protein